jgi:hypothetical protein
LTSDYINFLCPDSKKQSDSISDLETIIRQSLIREFSPDIQNSKSFDFLVDSIMYRVQKKSLENEPVEEEI